MAVDIMEIEMMEIEMMEIARWLIEMMNYESDKWSKWRAIEMEIMR